MFLLRLERCPMVSTRRVLDLSRCPTRGEVIGVIRSQELRRHVADEFQPLATGLAVYPSSRLFGAVMRRAAARSTSTAKSVSP